MFVRSRHCSSKKVIEIIAPKLFIICWNALRLHQQEKSSAIWQSIVAMVTDAR